MKLIKLSDTHYIVVDDSEIKDCYYYNSLDKAIRFGNNLNHPYHHKIIYSTENFGAGWQQKVMQLSLPEVEETIKNNLSETNVWNIYFDENNKINLLL